MLVSLLLSLSLLLVSWAEASAASSASDYHERLLLCPLPQSTLLASFNFRSNASSSSFEQQNFRYFPRSLGQILQHAHTKELHLRFSLGRWDADNWGARPWSGAREGGTGVELWAWVEADTEEAANARWLTLTNALSGLFCASLNFIDSTKTIRPVMTFEPEGTHSNASMRNLHLLHGTLPHEVVCTENLTPFLKLLPCKGKAGISSLLDGHKLFDANWQTMAVDVKPVCPEDGTECILQIEQTVDMVLDIERSKRPRDNPMPRPIPAEDLVCDTSKPYHGCDSCFPLDRTSEMSWSLNEVFGRPLKGSCPLTAEDGRDSETVCINVPHEREVQERTAADFVKKEHEDGYLRCYKMSPNLDFDLVLPEQSLSSNLPLSNPSLHAFRSITGHGQERGGVRAILTNPSLTSPVRFVYLESLPWFMKPYLHTLHATISSSTAPLPNQYHEPQQAPNTADPIKQMYYRPAVDRHRGTHLELLLEVPPASTLTLTYDFEKSLLRYTEYPPDANRGFDVAPAVMRLLSSPSNGSSLLRASEYLRTTSLLLPLPTPDFSMPYNVIILTSTVMALAFGSIFNILVRRFVAADEAPGYGLASLKGRIWALAERLRARLRGKGPKDE
ncbi:GPI transamidase component PIG-T [Cryomyces antarcticus]